MKKRLRIVHVAETLNLGGLEKLIVEFVRHADPSRFDPRVVTLGVRGDLADEVEQLGCPVHALNLPAGLRPRAIWTLAAHFRRQRIHILHTHSEGPLLYATPAARLAGVQRVVHTRHHGPDLGNSRAALAAMALVSRAVDRVVCVADAGARCARAEGIPASKLTTIHNGIDLSRFDYLGPASGGPVVIVARLVPEKDHPTLLRAVAFARAQEPSFRLDIAGDGPCLSAVQELAARLELGAHVRFLGRVDDVPALLSRSSALVLSSWLEGISLTLLEAMARGLPVVATDVGGNPEVVDDGRTGFLVPARDPSALAEALLNLWRDPALGRQFGRAGREEAERSFDIRQAVARYEAIYENRADQDVTANIETHGILHA
jgi:glycosyltransferase involved in cell wall biosynthesis